MGRRNGCCPAGESLHYRSTRRRRGTAARVYSGRAATCGRCLYRQQCTSYRVRSLEITEHYRAERHMREKLASAAGRLVYRQRQGQVEPVFANIKFNLGFTRFHLRRLAQVRGEFLLFCIAHNLRKLASQLALSCLFPILRGLAKPSEALSGAIWTQLRSISWLRRKSLVAAA